METKTQKQTMTAFYTKHCQKGGRDIEEVAKNTVEDLKRHNILKSKNGNVITVDMIAKIIKTVNYQISKNQQPKRFPFKVVVEKDNFRWVKIEA